MPEPLLNLESGLRELVRKEAFGPALAALHEYCAALEQRLRADEQPEEPARLLKSALDLFVWVRFSVLVSRQHTAAALAQLETVSRYALPPEPAPLSDIRA